MTAQSVHRGGRAGEVVDPRVRAVLDVLGGVPRPEVARRWSVDPAVLHRWVRDFVAAGTAQVTHRPDPETARQRDRFLSAYAHEMRSPLAVALGWTSMLRDGDLPPTTLAKGLDRLDDALSALSARTLDVEMLATASLGRLRVHPQPLTLAELAGRLDSATDLPTAGLPARCTPARLRDGAGAAPLHLDPVLVVRILRDLWRAAHLDPAPAEVHLDHAVAGPWDELRVVRRGDPVPTPVLQGLFDPFELADEQGVVTVGLYLARALAVTHGGAVGVEQDDEHTVLWLRLPRPDTGTDPDTKTDTDTDTDTVLPLPTP